MDLTDEQIASFRDEGYLIFPRFFDDEQMVGFKADMDDIQAKRAAGEPVPFMVDYPHLGQLIVEPRMLGIVEQVMGPGFAFHHLHATRQDAGTRGVHWHQDYEQEPQTNRSHVMVHVFYYFNGLNGEVGDLVFLPRTQKAVVSNGGLSHLGTQVLPGEVVVNDLPPGSAVLVHSALWHARRAQPGGEDRPRYFTDASYCQAGVKWPSYGAKEWRQILASAQRQQLGGPERAHLFDEAHFFEKSVVSAAWRAIPGSIALELKQP